MTGPAHLAVPAELTAIDAARTWAADQARAAGFGPEAIGDLELAMSEAMSNVVRHGYGPGSDGSMEVEVVVDADRLEVCILDRAPTFSAAAIPPRDLDEITEGGYGLGLIEQVMDEVHRAPRPGGGNTLTLIKHRHKGTPNG